MQEPDFNLAKSTIAIVGLGLMGGSLAMGLKGKCAALFGVDPHYATRKMALSRGIVDQAGSDPAPLLAQADMIILSAPVPAILSLLADLPLYTSRPCVVMDLGSTKRLIVEAMARLPEGFDPIGGHPICGRERLSLENADPAMYREAPFVLTPTGRTSPRAMDAARQVIEALGAWSMILEAVEHDRMLAYTSHLPFLVSSALVRSVPKAAASLPGPGFKSASRLSGTPTSMMLGVLETNREFILTALRDMMAQLSEIESSLIAQDFVGLESILNESRDKHQVFKI